MGEINSSYVVKNLVFEMGDRQGRSVKQMEVQFTITMPQADAQGYGTSTNTISAARFGLKKIVGASNLVDVDGKLILAGPSPDGASLYTYKLVEATDANRATPADIVIRKSAGADGVFKGVVWGTPA